MMHILVPLCLLAVLSGCSISAEGVRSAPLPPAVQGSDDVQGAPLSTPGAGMGSGSGNSSGATGAAGKGRR